MLIACGLMLPRYLRPRPAQARTELTGPSLVDRAVERRPRAGAAPVEAPVASGQASAPEAQGPGSADVSEAASEEESPQLGTLTRLLPVAVIAAAICLFASELMTMFEFTPAGRRGALLAGRRRPPLATRRS